MRVRDNEVGKDKEEDGREGYQSRREGSELANRVGREEGKLKG